MVAAVVALLALAGPAYASQVLEYHHGRLIPHEDPYLPPPAGPEAALLGSEQACPSPPPPTPALPKVRAARGPSVNGAIATARRRGSITAANAASYRHIYAATRHRRAGASGRNRRELSAVISVLDGIAARGSLTGSRMPALFLQLERNREFWHGRPNFPVRTDLLPNPCTHHTPGNNPAGSRIVFPESPVVFQYYPGQGLQLQPLANFGMANGLYKACRHDPATCDRTRLRKLLDDMIAIRSRRGSFYTWEYFFYFGGGTPPWTSGLSSGAAVQSLSRASLGSILNDKKYLRAARSALGVFRTPPPVGVRVRSGRGSHYLIYSFAPGERVLNGFLEAITGLFDYTRVSRDPAGRALWQAGDRAAQSELHLYDTGRWSRYSAGGPEASLDYHRLVTGFLDNLCARLRGKYCTYYNRFHSYLGQKPIVTYLGKTEGTTGTPLTLRYNVSKASCTTVRVEDASGAEVFRYKRKVARGRHSVKWTPAAPGTYKLVIGAVDQNKNDTSPSWTITVG